MAVVIPPLQVAGPQQPPVSVGEHFPHIMYHLEKLLRNRVDLLEGPMQCNWDDLYVEIAPTHLIPAVIVSLPYSNNCLSH